MVWSPDLAVDKTPANTAQPATGTPRRGPMVPGFITRTQGDTAPSDAASSSGAGRGAAPVAARPVASGSHAAPPHPGLDAEPVPSPDGARRKPVSRYQQLLDEAERKRAEEAATARGAVDLRFVEDEPSADDETLEDSGLVGRTAIERILNGRLVEERSVDGT